VFSIKTDFEFINILKSNLAEKYKRKRRTVSERVHVSDILPSSCLRRQYYSRIMPEEHGRQSFNFRRYYISGLLLQLLYYMVMTQIEKGILAIRYEVKDLQWVGRDSQGDHYVRTLDAKPPDMECFQIILSFDDPMRTTLKQQMILRKDLFLKALATKNVKILPRFIGKDKTIKCKHCQFKTRCWDEDGETIEAMKLATEHRSNRLFDDLINNSMVNNHID
jgi:hypothetical protein